MADLIPKVFNEDILPLQQSLQKRLEANLGRALAPADIEMLISNAFAYEIQLLRIRGNEAFRQNQTRFSSGIMLEYLGELVGVKRLPASFADTTIRFTLIAGHNPLQIPSGIRVQSIDSTVIFITNNTVDVGIDVDFVDIEAVCQTSGSIGNGYDEGKISIILDPQPFLVSAGNITVTSGGTDEESDDQLRSRINLAPSSFSVAGPRGAYEFFAKSAHPSIVDVAVITTQPGEVTIYPLCADGTLPSLEVLNKVLSICDDEKIRPQNDTVLVDEPTVVSYTISVQLTTYTGAINSEVLAEVTETLNNFKNERNNRLGMDVITSQIVALSIVKDKVYDVNVLTPSADIIADPKTYTKCTGITVTIIGSNNG